MGNDFRLLDAKPQAVELVWGDLASDKQGKSKKQAGAKGMTAEQVLCFAIVKMKEQLAYRDLDDRVDDSLVLRKFCRIGHKHAPAFTTLQENIKRIRPETWESINALIVGYACERKVEDGRRVRIDTTGVESNIHHPTDSHQLWDCVRVLSRILQRVEAEIERLRGHFHDHRRVAKKMFFRIHNTPGQDNKKPLYRKLITAAQSHWNAMKRPRIPRDISLEKGGLVDSVELRLDRLSVAQDRLSKKSVIESS